jgi:hypothetical protein
MIKRLLATAAVLGFGCIAVLAQKQPEGLGIKPKTIVYKRTMKGLPDYKQKFTIRYPVVTGRLPMSVRKTIERNLSYWTNFDDTLRENLSRDYWLESYNYEVRYNKNNLLDVWLTGEGSAAYPDSHTKYIVLDTRSGKRLAISDVFTASKLPLLLKQVRNVMRRSEAALDSESRKELDEIRELQPEFYPTPEKLLLKNLYGFSVSDKGITFIYEYDYAHVVQALEPSGEFFIPYSELKPFIKRGSLLERFVK